MIRQTVLPFILTFKYLLQPVYISTDVTTQALHSNSIQTHIYIFSKRDFSTLKHPDWLWGPPSLLFCEQQVPFPWVKWPGHEDDHSPLYSAKVTDKLNYVSTSTPSTCLNCADIDNFTFAICIIVTAKFH